MAPILFLGFILIPIAEIAVFIQVGEEVGLWTTLGVIVLTAALGTALLRQQGLATIAQIQNSLAENVLPVRALFEGLCLIIAGALLITPGFLTDGAGFLLFVPACRRAVAGALLRAAEKRGSVQGNAWSTGHSGSTEHPRSASDGKPHGGRAHRGNADVIDGEYEDVTPGEGTDAGPSPSSGDNPSTSARETRLPPGSNP